MLPAPRQLLLLTLVLLTASAASACRGDGGGRAELARRIAEIEADVAEAGVQYERFITKSNRSKADPKLKALEDRVTERMETLRRLELRDPLLEQYRDLRVQELTLAVEHARKERLFISEKKSSPDLPALKEKLIRTRAQIVNLEEKLPEVPAARKAVRAERAARQRERRKRQPPAAPR